MQLISESETLKEGGFWICFGICKIEEKDKVMVNSYAMFQIREDDSQMFFKLGVLKNFANFIGKNLC